MADSNLLAGFAFVTINGQSYRIAGEGAYRLSQNTRGTLSGQDGIHGYSEMPTAGKISWKGRDGSTVVVSALNDAVNATVVLQLANGKMIVARNAWRTGEPVEVSSEDATFSIEFDSPDVTEN